VDVVETVVLSMIFSSAGNAELVKKEIKKDYRDGKKKCLFAP